MVGFLLPSRMTRWSAFCQPPNSYTTSWDSTSTSPRRGEKASYYSAVCLDTGEVEVMELEGNSNSATSAAFLRQLRARHAEPLTVIWDNSPAHRGDAVRAYLATPGLNLRLVNPVSSTGQALPSYSPDFNADEAIWGWARQEATANLCLTTRAAVQEKVGDSLQYLRVGLAHCRVFGLVLGFWRGRSDDIEIDWRMSTVL